jgi:hypothetical protein
VKNPAQLREARDLADHDAVDRHGLRRQHQIQEIAADFPQRFDQIRFPDIGGMQSPRLPPAFVADHGREQFLLAGEMGVQRRLRHIGRSRDGVHAGGAIALFHEQRLGGIQDLGGFGAGRRLMRRRHRHSVLRGVAPFRGQAVGRHDQTERWGFHLTTFNSYYILWQD